jgi:hypothetical protein
LKGEIVVLDCFFGLDGHFEGILGDDIFWPLSSVERKRQWYKSDTRVKNSVPFPF